MIVSINPPPDYVSMYVCMYVCMLCEAKNEWHSLQSRKTHIYIHIYLQLVVYLEN